MKTFYKTLAAGGLAAAPAFAFAQSTISELLGRVSAILNLLVPFIVGLAVLVIIWGIFNYIVGAGDEEKRAEAKQYIIWGVIGVFIMLSVWGLVNVLVGSFTFSNKLDKEEFPRLPSGDPSLETIPGGGNL